MNWNTFLGVTASTSFLLPVAAIVYYKLYTHRSLAALLISYSITSLYNFAELQLIPMPASFTNGFGVVNNYLDIPLMLTALLFFCPIKQKQKTVHVITGLFLAYEVVLAIQFGLQPKVVVYIMGPGLLLILAYAFYLFVRHIRNTIVYGKNAGRTLMLAAILFSYSCYGFIYYFYYLQKTGAVSDIYLLYYLSSIFSCVLMCIGLALTNKRLKLLNDLKVTRRELQMFFNT
ncbi:MAG TPA: hypothetical protein VHK91_13405 [Flavisolibacter sp.]|jgi:hypothetical protein|nr:hypothetical protein [Flavisolibacter sp.]